MEAPIDLCSIPAMQPPPGKQSNFEDPPSLANTALGVSSVMTTWGCLFVVARIYVNFGNLKLADLLSVVALVFDIGHMVVVVLSRRTFRHMWDLPVCWITPEHMQLGFANAMIAPFAVSLSKATVLVLFLSIFDVNKKMRLAIYVGIVLNFLLYAPNLVVAPILAAPHVGETWEHLALSQRPAKQKWIGAFQGPGAVLLDIYILVLPYPALRKLNMPSNRRMKLAVVFGTALLGVVASFIACVFRIKLLKAKDLTWADGQVFLPIIVENYIALIVGCMPAFAKFLRTTVTATDTYKKLRSQFSYNQSSVGSSFKPRATIGSAGKRSMLNRFDSTTQLGLNQSTGYYELDENQFSQTRSDVTAQPIGQHALDRNRGPGIKQTREVLQTVDNLPNV